MVWRSRSFCDAKAAETRCGMLPVVPESDVEPSELERLALRSNRLLSKLADVGDKKNECVACVTEWWCVCPASDSLVSLQSQACGQDARDGRAQACEAP